MVDLHLHLDGSLTANEIISLARADNVSLPTFDEKELNRLICANENCESLSEYLEKFEIPLSVLQSEKNLETAVYFLLKRLNEQGIAYAEIRFAPLLHTRNKMSVETATQSAVNGLEKACGEFPIKANLILCLMRIDGCETENLQTVKVAKDFLGKGVCAIDLAGGELGNPTEKYSNPFNLAELLRIPFTIHAGEADSAQNVVTAVRYGAKRIGHGVKCANDENAKSLLKRRNVLLELCYTSNLQTKAVLKGEEYPLKRFLNEGVKVSINTDNTTVSNTTLKNEYLKIKNLYSFENETLKTLCLNAVESAFISDSEKEEIKEKVNSNFFNWIGE